jgi:hypothetical protein
MASLEVRDLALMDNEARAEAYRTKAKIWDLDAHPAIGPMVAALVERYKADRPELFAEPS